MPDLSPAETLTAAAQALRDAANAARYEMKTSTYWQGLEPETAWERGISNAVGGHAGGFCALMGPSVALAFADWLQLTADVINSRTLADPADEYTVDISDEHALVVARRILGGAS